MCGSRKYPYPPHGWSLEILRGEGWGSQRPKFSKEIIKLNWSFWRGRGVPSKKTTHEGRMDIFWNHTVRKDMMI